LKDLTPKAISPPIAAPETTPIAVNDFCNLEEACWNSLADLTALSIP
jgi:hypothetical protein